MARGNDERYNPKRRVDRRPVDLDNVYAQAAYDELVKGGDVPLRDLPVEDHPDFRNIIWPRAQELMQRDADEVHWTAMQDDPETREERLDRLGGEADDYESGR